MFCPKCRAYAWFSLTCYLWALGVGHCLKQSCPRGIGVGQIKNNFSLILEIMCYFLRGLHKAAELKTTYF